MKKEFKKNESLRQILNAMKHNNICTMGIPEGEESEQRIKNVFEEIMTANALIWSKKKTHMSKKFRESQTSWTQRGLHQDTS